MSTKFIVLTDTHFVPPGKRLFGGNPRARLEKAVRIITRDHADAEFVLVTGDLAHHGEAGAYRSLEDVLSGCRLPIHLMMGNHDHRETLLQNIPGMRTDKYGFVQFCLETPELRVICLDTAEPGTHVGNICEARLEFLDRELAKPSEGKLVALALHHPPFEIGLRPIDRINLKDGGALKEVIDAHQKPDYLFFGHVHRPVQGLWNGIPYSIQYGINHQVALDFSEMDMIPLTFAPPQFSVAKVGAEKELLIHSCSFLYDGPFFSNSFDVNEAVINEPL